MRIAPGVLTTIVSVIATAVPGVVAMGRVPGTGLFRRFRRDDTRGIRLSVRENSVSLDLYVAVAQGVNMLSTGAAIQREVSANVTDLLGMDVADVNVFIQNVE